ncbi:MAG: hypothetical protein H0U18_12430 [Pyrinomonadaceae bacterium]|nr:hypothetical protein [Pyrinomonadaceae bacterium]
MKSHIDNLVKIGMKLQQPGRALAGMSLILVWSSSVVVVLGVNVVVILLKGSG